MEFCVENLVVSWLSFVYSKSVLARFILIFVVGRLKLFLQILLKRCGCPLVTVFGISHKLLPDNSRCGKMTKKSFFFVLPSFSLSA